MGTTEYQHWAQYPRLKDGLPASYGSRATLKRRRRARAHDLAHLAADVAKAMRNGAREVVGVARIEDSHLSAHRQLDAARDDDAAFLALVAQHVGARVGLRPIAFMHDRHRAIRMLRGDEAQRHVAIADVGELLACIKHLRVGL